MLPHFLAGFSQARRLLITAVALVLVVNVARAETLAGRVVKISDGDTLTVLDASRQQHKVRLAGIDAPEKRQPFGSRSKENLSRLAFDKEVTVDWQKRDRFDRIVGKVLVNGQDVNLEQIKAGVAWHFKRYQEEQPLEDRVAYGQAESEARAARRGIGGSVSRLRLGNSDGVRAWVALTMKPKLIAALLSGLFAALSATSGCSTQSPVPKHNEELAGPGEFVLTPEGRVIIIK
jgi:endonuclease YncB( thermonuclease family)